MHFFIVFFWVETPLVFLDYMRTLRNIVFLDLETKVKTLYFEIMSTVVKILTRHMDLLHELCGLDTLSTLQ